ncbi:GLPGLI family protein [Chitinophaga japonensis]|uniref:GLPGLI family protein n=1 Tax=Chitinophaga japonensis TaxID=104662 RepID=A0A562T5J7_CHIJA|nr:GLPGLI family protein [Chitinophaga japonensis]TWI88817.1 GLPGLI family protein [Chitinophaga japonensis]
MFICTLISWILLLPGAVTARQQAFISSGKIIFERRVNTFAAMEIFLGETGRVPKEQIPLFMQQYRSTAPQFWTENFELYFDRQHTLYQPENPDMDHSPTFVIPIAYNNRVYSDLSTKETVATKQAFEKTFHIKDELRKIRWKLTDETREIAGFQCRRANALLFDSVYVVAFYTDEILTKGGPEAFNGLPGMILGVAIPYQHITIFAKAVTRVDTQAGNWKLQEKGNDHLIDSKEFTAIMDELLRQFGFTAAWVRLFMTI